MALTGIHSHAKIRGQIPRFATTGMAPYSKPLSSALRIAKPLAQVAKNTCGKIRPVAIRSQIRLLAVAIRKTVILFVAIRSLIIAD
jgi:hypothetical protein